MMKGTILVVEDSQEINDMLKNFLHKQGYEVECAYDGRAASVLLRNKEYTIVLMDLMLPFKSGEQLIEEMRANQKNTPVICLSAKSQVETRLEVLRMGADDYILKPFDLNEVLVRIEVVLRRSMVTKEETDDTEESVEVLEYDGVRLFPSENRVEYQGSNVALTLKEMLLLQLFFSQPTKTFTKANLYESVWEDIYYYEDNTINVHMSNLRSKLKKATGRDYIETVWGIGYRLKTKA